MWQRWLVTLPKIHTSPQKDTLFANILTTRPAVVVGMARWASRSGALPCGGGRRIIRTTSSFHGCATWPLELGGRGRGMRDGRCERACP